MKDVTFLYKKIQKNRHIGVEMPFFLYLCIKLGDKGGCCRTLYMTNHQQYKTTEAVGNTLLRDLRYAILPMLTMHFRTCNSFAFAEGERRLYAHS